MPEPFLIIGLLAAGKAAITGWIANKGLDFIKEKSTGFAGDKAKEFGKTQLAQFHENARLHLRRPDQSIPKALRFAYLQATLQVCALRSDELGANVASYSQHLADKILRWKKRYNENLGVLAQAEAQWLDNLHKWLRTEIDKAKEGKLPLLEITDQGFASLVSFEDDSDDETLRQRITDHLITEIDQACPGMSDKFRSLLIEGWFQFDIHEQPQKQTWFDCFCACFQQALAKDPQARDFFQTKLLAGIAHQQQPIDFDQFAEALRRLNEQLASRDVSIYFDDLSSQLDKGFIALHNHIDTVAGKVDQVEVKIEESTELIIDGQREQTEILLGALRGNAAPAKPQSPPEIIEVRRYLQELIEKTTELPTYYPEQLRQRGGTIFGEIRQTVQVVKDRASFQQWAEDERQRAMGQFDDVRRYSPYKSRPETDGYYGNQQTTESPMDWEKASDVYSRAVILGDPGFGKSWLLRYEARRLSQQSLTQLDAGATLDEIQLPILTRLADVARAAKMSTVTEALARLASRSDQDNALSAAFNIWVVQHLKNGKCIVLLDAWDEVAQEPALPNEVLSRKELAEKLSHFSAPHVLLTSRGVGYTGSPIANAQELELIAFEQNQIEHFARVWFDAPDDAARFLSLMKARPAIHGLARIPLMLSLLSRMFTAKKAEAFPQTRCEIYERCLRGLLQDWKEEKQPGVEIEDADAILEALSAIALALPIEQGAFKRSFLRQQIQQWSVRLRPGDSLFGQTPETLIQRLMEDGILIKANDERDPDYLFLHRTFHEYLTACALSQTPDWLEQALQKIYDPAWLQVLILLGGKLKMPGQAERYIAALRNEHCPNTLSDQPEILPYKDIFFRPFTLAVFAAQEAVEELSEQTQNKLFGETLQNWLKPPHWLNPDWFLNALFGWNKSVLPILRNLSRFKDLGLRVRGAAAIALIKLQDSEALPDIFAFLSDEEVDPGVRSLFAQCLNGLQDGGVLPDIFAFLRDEKVDPQVRHSAAQALIRMRYREALPDLRNILCDEGIDPQIRSSIAEALGNLQDCEALPDLRALFRHEGVNLQLRCCAAYALVKLQDHEALPEIFAFLRDERVAPPERCYVAQAFYWPQHHEALPGLRDLLRDEELDADVRSFVAHALVMLQDREVLPDLRNLLRDEQVDSEVRHSAAQSLIWMQDREALPDLRALLRDERANAQVRSFVARGLGDLQDSEALPDLRALLRNRGVDAHVRCAAAQAMGKLQDREALPDTFAFLRDEEVDSQVRIDLVQALGELRDCKGLPDLRAILCDEQVSAQVRCAVAQALGEMKDCEALPNLRAISRGKEVDAHVRNSAAKALAKLQDREVLPELRDLLRDKGVDAHVRDYIRDALWKIAQAEKAPIRFE
jgi:HEAT repeat protein